MVMPHHQPYADVSEREMAEQPSYPRRQAVQIPVPNIPAIPPFDFTDDPLAEMEALATNPLAPPDTADTENTILDDPEVAKEFRRALYEGKLEEFFAAHPDLAPRDYGLMWNLIREAAAGRDPEAQRIAEERRQRTGLPGPSIGSDEVEEAKALLVQHANEDGYYIAATTQTPGAVSEEIAQKVGSDPVTVGRELMTQNPDLTGLDEVPEGAVITLPNTGRAITVKAGESLETIAEENGVTVQVLMAVNGLMSPDDLQVGMSLTIPNMPPTTSAEVPTGPPGGEQTYTAVPETAMVDPQGNPVTSDGTYSPLATDDEQSWLAQLPDSLRTQAILSDLMQGYSPSYRADRLDDSSIAQMNAVMNLMLATGQFSPFEGQDQYDMVQSLLEAPPSAGSIQEQLLSLANPQGVPAQNYLADPSNPLSAVQALLMQSLGARGASLFYGPDTEAVVMSEMAQNPQGNVIQVLQRLGYLPQ